MSGLVPDFGRLQTQTNQAFVLGNQRPPDMSQVGEDLLKAASPRSFNLTTTRTDQSLSEAQARKCRTEYRGIGGLRQLQKVQEDHTALQPGCGWVYQMPEGVTNPVKNNGVLGTMMPTPSGGLVETPVFGGTGQIDEVKGRDASFTMDLEKAERNLSQKIVQRMNGDCRNLQDLTSENKQFFGFCKTSKTIIPVQTVDGQIRARYPKDPTLKCAPDQIVPASSAPSGCPPTSQTEGFVGTQGCTLPFTKSCLMQFTRTAGCSDKGAIIKALQTASGDAPFDTSLKTKDAYKYYTAKANLTPALFRDGSVASRSVAIEELNRLAEQANETPSEANKGITAAARDLCLQEGYFLDSYDFCTELTSETRLNTENFNCALKLWRQAGGDAKGFLYPKLGEWSGKTIGQLNRLIEQLKEQMKSTDKSVQATAIRNFIGVETFKQLEVDGLPRSPDLVGAETVWIYYENWNTEGAVPIIMRCDTLMQKNVGGKILPVVNNNLVPAYLMPSNEGVAFMSAFEIRPENDATTSFKVLTDDGFSVGRNQMPGQGIANNTDWSGFVYQPPAWYNSPTYQLSADSKNKRNMFSIKWFQGPGGATFLMQRNGKSIDGDPYLVNDMYLTQEPLAPWLQYEICSRPNNGRPATLGFFEKRWNGPCAFPWENGTKWRLLDQKPIPSFDCESSQVSYTTDANFVKGIPTRGYMSFTPNSWWRTRSCFAFNSMRCMTLLVRPRATLAAKGMGSIMWWPGYYRGWSSIGMETPGLWLFSPDGRTYQFDFWIGNRGHSYMDCKVNDWNLIVMYMVGDPSRGLEKFACAAAPLDSLRNAQGLQSFMTRLDQMRSSTGNILIPRISNPYQKGFSGPLILGGGNPEGNSIQRYSFSGDIAWMHGFNHYLTAELLTSEVNQTWRSRWPVSPLDKPDRPRMKVIGNNGTVSCETYCRGTNGAPWNNELPRAWNGAQCVSTNLPGVDCYTIPGRPVECICEQKANCPMLQGFTNPEPTPTAAPASGLSKFKW